MNEIKVFDNEQFGQVRTMLRDGEPWFVAADVCRALEIKNGRDAVARLDDDEKMTVGLTDSHSGQRGGAQMQTLVNEPGLYTLVLGSRKPEAKAFKRWITHEVIPSIRKTGGYIAGQEELDDEALLARALKVAERQIAQREKRIAELMPKALYADAISGSPSSISVGALAKMMKQNGVDIGRTRLFAYLRKHKYLNSYGQERNVPSQYSMNNGFFEIKESLINRPDGTQVVYKTPMVTMRGQEYL